MQSQYQLVLATDLDGTFLEGDQQVKDFLYRELMHLHDDILLIYVTGRSIASIEEFCQLGFLPSPHFIIGDHGTHIVDGKNFVSIECLQNAIIKKWNKGNNILKKLLENESGLQLQPLDPPYRVAYYYDEVLLQNKTLQKIVDAGFDYILSLDQYLDIVPRGVNKGTTLLHLLHHLNIEQEIVITAGDSLNDLSLFQTGINSIAVGNSEPKLIDEIQTLNNVYHSKFPGLWGILDGLYFFDKLQLLHSRFTNNESFKNHLSLQTTLKY